MSQRDEERYILEFFGDRVGRVLEIGAYHPITFSNSKALIDKGWEAVLVEPSAKCLPAIKEYYKDSKTVQIVPYAIGVTNSPMKFYDSAGAVATALEFHYNKWRVAQLDYEETQVPCITWERFYSIYPGKFEFISIDTEGMDYSILSQIDLDKTETELICIEYTYNQAEIIAYLSKYNFRKVVLINSENLLVSR